MTYAIRSATMVGTVSISSTSKVHGLEQAPPTSFEADRGSESKESEKVQPVQEAEQAALILECIGETIVAKQGRKELEGSEANLQQKLEASLFRQSYRREAYCELEKALETLKTQHRIEQRTCDKITALIREEDFKGALSVYWSAIDAQLLQSFPESLLVASTSYAFLGHVHSMQNNLGGAILNHLSSWKILHELVPDSLAEANAFVHLGYAFERMDNLPRALALYTEAYAIRRKLAPLTMDTVSSCIKLGTVLYKQRDFDSALMFYREALSTVEYAFPESTKALADMHIRMGIVLHQKGDTEGAIKVFQTSLKLCESAAQMAVDRTDNGNHQDDACSSVLRKRTPAYSRDEVQRTKTLARNNMHGLTSSTKFKSKEKARRNVLQKKSGTSMIIDEATRLQLSLTRQHISIRAGCDLPTATVENELSVAGIAVEKPWTMEENNVLKMKRAQGLSWDEIAEILPGTTPGGCQRQYQILLETLKQAPTVTSKLSRTTKVRWSSKEDLLLRQKKVEGLSWDEIVKFFPKRSSDACRSHYKACIQRRKRKRNYKRHRWSERDRRLVQASYLTSFPRW